MGAYKTYELHGKNSRGKPVSIAVRLLATPTYEVAAFLLHEKYPSATDVTWTSPAAHRYPKPEPVAVKATTLATTPVRRAG
jgi:hypothetical protein